MKCQYCNNREANVEYTQIINGQKMKLILCEECARDINIGIDFNFGFDNIFSDFFNEVPGIKQMPQASELICPNCKMSYDVFINNGKFGCSKCYETFETRLDDIFKRLHGGNRHIKKLQDMNIANEKPRNEKTDKNDEINKLKEKLQEHIQKEEYEKAAIIRDQIKKML